MKQKVALALFIVATIFMSCSGDDTLPVDNSELNDFSPYIFKVFEYNPAPGQFVNKMPKYEENDTYNDMLAKATKALVGKDSDLITLGGWGGFVTFGFDHTIPNIKGKKDFRVEGNAVANSSEPGVVMVSYDANGNGIPDDEWYEIKGSANFTAKNEDWYQLAKDNGNDVAIHRNYEMVYYKPIGETPAEVEQDVPSTDDIYIHKYIRWSNNIAGEGYKIKNTKHRQSYYPLWIKDDSITFNGIRLAENGVDEMGQGRHFVLKSYKYGYVDNHSNRDDRSAIDIDWAVDKEGNKASLPGINFVRVYTAVDQENGWLGEASTEVGGASDLHLLGESIDSIEK